MKHIDHEAMLKLLIIFKLVHYTPVSFLDKLGNWNHLFEVNRGTERPPACVCRPLAGERAQFSLDNRSPDLNVT